MGQENEWPMSQGGTEGVNREKLPSLYTRTDEQMKLPMSWSQQQMR